MNDSFRLATGRKVMSRASASDLGAVAHLLVDIGQHRIAAVVIGRGRKAQIVDWSGVSGFGPDAVMVGSDDALRAPADDRERAAADGKLDLLGQRVLTERGNELGTVADVTFDPHTGVLSAIRVGDRELPAGSLLGNGSYAAVVDDREPDVTGAATPSAEIGASPEIGSGG